MARIRDLRGQRFGDRVVIGAAPSKGHKAWWFVRCKCGQVDAVQGFRLTSGGADRCRACGYVERTAKQLSAAEAEYVGKVFGRRTVLSVKSGGDGIISETRCECGYVSDIPLSHLALRPSCPKCAALTHRADVIGKKFGKRTVVAEAREHNGKRYVVAQCECGRKDDVALGSLMADDANACLTCANIDSSETRFQKMRATWIGRKSGKRTVLDVIHTYRHLTALVECECGTQDKVRLSAFRYGVAGSCKSCRRKGKTKARLTPVSRFHCDDLGAVSY